MASFMSCGTARFFQQGRREAQGGQTCGLDHLGWDTIAALPFKRASIALPSPSMVDQREADCDRSDLRVESSSDEICLTQIEFRVVFPQSVHFFLEVYNGFAVFCFKGYSFLF